MATNQDLIDAINELARVTTDAVFTQKTLAAQQAAAAAVQKQANAQAAATRAANQQAKQAAAIAQRAADDYAASAPGRLAAVRSGAYAKEYAEKLRVEAANRQAAQAERAAENRAKYGRFGGIAGAYQSVGGPGLAGGTYGALQVAQAAGTQFRDPYQTNEQSASATFKAIPVAGHAAGIGEAIGGRAARMAAAEVMALHADVGRQGETERDRMRYQLGTQADQSNIRAAVLTRASMPAFAGGDRSSAASEQQFQFAKRLLPLKDQQAEAEREQTIAVQNRVAAQNRLVGLEKQESALLAEQVKIRGWKKWSESGSTRVGRQLSEVQGNTDRVVLASQITGIGTQLENLSRLRQQATQDVANARVGEARAGGNVRQAAAGVAREKLGQTQQLGDQFRQSAERLGALGVGGRQQAKNAYDIVKEIGIDSAGPDLVNLARQFAPAEIAKLTEAAGVASPQYAAGRAASPSEFGDIAANQASEVEQTNKIRELGLENEKLTARGIDTALGSGLADAIDKLIRDRVATMKDQIENRLSQRRPVE